MTLRKQQILKNKRNNCDKSDKADTDSVNEHGNKRTDKNSTRKIDQKIRIPSRKPRVTRMCK